MSRSHRCRKGSIRLARLRGGFVYNYVEMVMQLDQVEFIDRSGLGALTRLMHIARSKGGDLKLSGLQQHIRYRVVGFKKRDQLGHLEHLYLGSRYSPGRAGDTRPRVVCLFESSDVREFPRMLGQAAVKLPKRYRRAMSR